MSKATTYPSSSIKQAIAGPSRAVALFNRAPPVQISPASPIKQTIRGPSHAVTHPIIMSSIQTKPMSPNKQSFPGSSRVVLSEQSALSMKQRHTTSKHTFVKLDDINQLQTEEEGNHYDSFVTDIEERTESTLPSSKKELRKLAEPVAELWRMGGDFNAMMCRREKNGGEGFNSCNCKAFSTCPDDCVLLDLDFIGPLFTWLRGSAQKHIDPMVCDAVGR
ncbi:unnamed protein product [Dovyalis caffra]|uniref:Uncharacterized protein n=1 Tax=Dovyalis caffra TaxID=77055 RepID=A0AAV1SN04_9ROSI|nr:unnamed protein product [Dovyalis caffra]